MRPRVKANPSVKKEPRREAARLGTVRCSTDGQISNSGKRTMPGFYRVSPPINILPGDPFGITGNSDSSFR
jgi:hypothetical protein